MRRVFGGVPIVRCEPGPYVAATLRFGRVALRPPYPFLKGAAVIAPYRLPEPRKPWATFRGCSPLPWALLAYFAVANSENLRPASDRRAAPGDVTANRLH